MNVVFHQMSFFLQPLFAFLYKEQFPVDGWKVYDPTTEYKRQVRSPKLCMQDLVLVWLYFFHLPRKLIYNGKCNWLELQ